MDMSPPPGVVAPAMPADPFQAALSQFASQLNALTQERTQRLQNAPGRISPAGPPTAGMMQSPARAAQNGMIEPGNIDLGARKVLNNQDGSISTESSFSANIDGVEVLLPTIINGRRVSDDAAIQHYIRTGEHLGKFSDPQSANKFANELHEKQGARYQPDRQGEDINSISDLVSGQRMMQAAPKRPPLASGAMADVLIAEPDAQKAGGIAELVLGMRKGPYNDVAGAISKQWQNGSAHHSMSQPRGPNGQWKPGRPGPSFSDTPQASGEPSSISDLIAKARSNPSLNKTHTIEARQ